MKLKSIIVCVFIFTISTGKLWAQQQQMPLPRIIITTSGNVSGHDVRNFNRDFKDALNPAWPALNKKYIVQFISSLQENGTQPKQAKQVAYVVTYVNVNNVPFYISRGVADKYPGYQVSGAIKIEGNGKNIWMAEAKNDEKLMVVSIDEGNMSNIKELGNYYRFM